MSETAKPIYLASSQSVDVRVPDLLSRMTVKEKAGQLNMIRAGGPGMIGDWPPDELMDWIVATVGSLTACFEVG